MIHLQIRGTFGEVYTCSRKTFFWKWNDTKTSFAKVYCVDLFYKMFLSQKHTSKLRKSLQIEEKKSFVETNTMLPKPGSRNLPWVPRGTFSSLWGTFLECLYTDLGRWVYEENRNPVWWVGKKKKELPGNNECMDISVRLLELASGHRWRIKHFHLYRRFSIGY